MPCLRAPIAVYGFWAAEPVGNRAAALSRALDPLLSQPDNSIYPVRLWARRNPFLRWFLFAVRRFLCAGSLRRRARRKGRPWSRCLLLFAGRWLIACPDSAGPFLSAVLAYPSCKAASRRLSFFYLFFLFFSHGRHATIWMKEITSSLGVLLFTLFGMFRLSRVHISHLPCFE